MQEAQLAVLLPREVELLNAGSVKLGLLTMVLLMCLQRLSLFLKRLWISARFC